MLLLRLNQKVSVIQIKEGLISFLLFAIIILTLAETVNATTMSFTVPRGEELTKSISLVVDDRVLIEFTVVGQKRSELDFYITDPQGNVKVEHGQVGIVKYCFVCDTTGEYVLHFSNTDQSEDKLVTLNYEVQHYIFGMPQTLFLTLFIVLVCVGAVATFILMGKPR